MAFIPILGTVEYASGAGYFFGKVRINFCYRDENRLTNTLLELLAWVHENCSGKNTLENIRTYGTYGKNGNIDVQRCSIIFEKEDDAMLVYLRFV